MASSSHWLETHCTLTIGEIVKDKSSIISVDCHATLSEVLDLMRASGVSAVGVHRVSGVSAVEVHRVSDANEAPHPMLNTSTTPPIEYLGIITVSDILQRLGLDWGKAGFRSPIGSLQSMSPGANNAFVASAGDKLYPFVQACSTGEVYHGIAVCQERNEFKMLAQSDFVAHILDCEQKLPQLLKLLDIPVHEVCSSTTSFVLEHAPLHDALDLLMHRHAVPVISATTGRIVETLSATDFTGSARMQHALANRNISVAAFLKNVNGGSFRAPLCINDNATLREAAQLMVRLGVHRLWVLQSGERAGDVPYLPRVISLTDFIATIVE